MKEDLLIYNTVENNRTTETPEAHFIPDIQDIMKTVDSMTTDIVYAIIRKYQMTEDPETVDDPPYGSKYLKKGLKVELGNLPPKLICILHTFLTKYYKREE